MLLDGNSLISTDPHCEIVACSPFDYIKFTLGDWTKTVDFLLEKYHASAQATPGTSLAALKPAFIEDLRSTRDNFEAVIGLRKRMLAGESLLPSFLWCRHRGFSVENGFRSFYLTRNVDLIPFLQHDSEQEIKLESEHYVVFPYLVNPHTFGWLKVFSAQTSAQFTIQFEKMSHAYYGLHTCLPDSNEVRIYGDPFTAQLAYSSETSMAHMQAGCVHVDSTGDADPNPYKLEAAVFVQTDKTPFSQIAQTRTTVNELSVINGSAEDPTLLDLAPSGTPWDSYVLSEATRFLQLGGADAPKLISLIDVVRDDRAMCEKLLRHLEAQNVPEVLARIRQHLNATKVYALSGMQVMETENGYVAKRKNMSVPFTNFTIRIDRNVHFEDAVDEHIHCGRLIMHGQEFPLVLPNRALNKPSEIPNACLNAIIKAGMGEQAGFFPQIVDSTLARRLSEVLKIQIATKSTSCHGVRRLGWSDDRSKFITPTWEITARGMRDTSRIPFPGSRFLQSHYDFRDYSYPTDVSKVTARVNSFICKLVSGLARSFLHLTVPPVEVLRNPNSIDLLHAMFQPFGQTSPLPFGTQIRTAQSYLTRDHIFGYPVFGVASDVSIVSRTNYPVFLISDSGVPFPEPLEGDGFAQVSARVRHVVSQVLLHCMRHPQRLHLLVLSEDEPSIPDMINEGKRIIEDSMGQAFNIFTSKLPNFEMLLGNVEFDLVSEYFRYDMPTQRIYIRMRKFPNFSRRDIVDELKAMNPDVQLHGNHYIAGPSEFLLGLMNDFYGKPVRLFHQDPEPETTTEPAVPDAAAQDAVEPSGS